MKFSRKGSESFKLPDQDPEDGVPPELVPIVTLLSAQAHRRYHEGIFMLYYDLNGDGKPGDRQWKEVYGILTGTQLAYWDAASLAKFKNHPDQLLETSSKPNYLNFADAMFNAIRTLPAAKQLLENVVIVSTTLKNRFILQFRTYDALTEWYLALRLSVFEYNALQEAYTGALLLARGLRLSDIRTILAEKRFNHMDWVKIRYGSGMAWKRCFAVIEPLILKRSKFVPGRVLLYENEKMKKQHLFGVIVSALSLLAVYPQHHALIDKLTIMKLEGLINFSLPLTKKTKAAAGSEETSLFIMPELHLAVAGYDTLIRFLIPLFDSFGLYGRPKRLKADRVDPDSLLFGLPTLPRVHYLMVSDLMPFAGNDAFLSWDARTWSENFKRILKLKLAQGYSGCGSSRGMVGALNSMTPKGSPVEKSTPVPERPSMDYQSQRSQASQVSPRRKPLPDSQSSLSLQNPAQQAISQQKLPQSQLRMQNPQVPSKKPQNLALDTKAPHMLVHLLDIYQKYSTIESPSDHFSDRNQILNGSAEDFEEEHIPQLMRKKLLAQGAYPTNDRHLLSDEESEEELLDELFAAPNTLTVPGLGHRNLSNSSVQLPGTQYDEFNQQFLKAAEVPRKSNLGYESSESELSISELPPILPQNRGLPNTANLPQLQNLSLDEKKQPQQQQQYPQNSYPQKQQQQQQQQYPQSSHPQQYPQQNQKAPHPYQQQYQQHPPYPQNAQNPQYPNQAASANANAAARNQNIQKSRPMQNLTLELQSSRPRHIASPNMSQMQSRQVPAISTTDSAGNSKPADSKLPTVAPTAAFRVPPPQQPVQPMYHPQQYPPQQYPPQQQYGYQNYQKPVPRGQPGIPPSVSAQPRPYPGNPGIPAAPGARNPPHPGVPGMAPNQGYPAQRQQPRANPVRNYGDGTFQYQAQPAQPAQPGYSRNYPPRQKQQYHRQY